MKTIVVVLSLALMSSLATSQTTPDITVYRANKEKNTGKAVLICPGGGYSRLAIEHEGSDFAEWLSKNGITAIVLKYRLPNHHYTLPLEDAQQAMRTIREKAAIWGVNRNEVGVMGFSAGGHLASTLLTHYDSASRPDFGILFYPVITFDPVYTHAGSVNSLLGDAKTEALITYFSNEQQVTPDTPPTLLLHSDDDRVVPIDNSLLFYNALEKNHVHASLCRFPTGGHGWGYRDSFPYHDLMKTRVLEWILEN